MQSQRIAQRLQDLLANPHEELDTELKGWLDMSSEEQKADLGQGILAIANHGGGYVLLGFAEKDGSWVAAEPRPTNLTSYSQDTINGIVQHYADPPFQCHVEHVPHPQSRQMFPIVIVPGGHKVPIRSKRDGPNGKHIRQNTYYIRRPGPNSEPPQSGREWDELIGRCVRAARDDLLEAFRDILAGPSASSSMKGAEEQGKLGEWIEGSLSRWKKIVSDRLPDEKPSRYASGTWFVAYSLSGNFRSVTLGELLEILRKIKGHETGWPAWWVPSNPEIAPYAYEGNIECWLGEGVRVFQDAAHSDFWRASPQGMMFLLRGYQEDGEDNKFEPGTILDLTIPIWRTGECLLHAARLAEALGDESASVAFRIRWDGLKGRILKPWSNPMRLSIDRAPSKQESASSQVVASANQISGALPELVMALTTPLYETFDFFKPSTKLVQEELTNMRKSFLNP
jgi:hypothetical protein